MKPISIKSNLLIKSIEGLLSDPEYLKYKGKRFGGIGMLSEFFFGFNNPRILSSENRKYSAVFTYCVAVEDKCLEQSK